MPHYHWPDKKGPLCRFKTKRECDQAYADWQAERWVYLAKSIVKKGHTGAFAKDDTVFGQLVRVVAGDKETITNDRGVESDSPFARRVLAALAAEEVQ